MAGHLLHSGSNAAAQSVPRGQGSRVLLLAVLSVLASWALHIVLAVGLLRILKPLEGVRRHLEKIAMGVRAIEQETRPLGSGAKRLAATLGETRDGLVEVVERLSEVDRDLAAVAPALQQRS